MSKAKMPLLWAIFTAMVFFACGDTLEVVQLTTVKIGISPKSIDFGTMPLKSHKEVPVCITNRDKIDICISWYFPGDDGFARTEIRQDDDDFAFSSDIGGSRKAAILKPDEKIEFNAIFFPTTVGQKFGILELLVGPRVYNSYPLPAAADTIRISLSGNCINNNSITK